MVARALPTATAVVGVVVAAIVLATATTFCAATRVGIDVNVNCLDEVPSQVELVEFDGRNWEKNAYKLAHKT